MSRRTGPWWGESYDGQPEPPKKISPNMVEIRASGRYPGVCELCGIGFPARSKLYKQRRGYEFVLYHPDCWRKRVARLQAETERRAKQREKAKFKKFYPRPVRSVRAISAGLPTLGKKKGRR